MRAINLIGKTFGKWTVIEKAERPPTLSPSKPLYWKCRCECGNIRIIPSHNLKGQNTRSCGDCYLNEVPYKTTYELLLYWSRERNIPCSITFEDFMKFVTQGKCHYCHKQLSWKPHGQTNAYYLDRMDNNKFYTPDNCVACCPRCNASKANRYTYDEWFRMNECFRSK